MPSNAFKTQNVQAGQLETSDHIKPHNWKSATFSGRNFSGSNVSCDHVRILQQVGDDNNYVSTLTMQR
jgi:hypothetical protein